MKSRKRTACFLLAAALLLFCSCKFSDTEVEKSNGESSVSSESAGAAAQRLYCGETELRWEVPQNEYRIVDAVAGEGGYAVLYVEKRPEDNEPKEYRHAVMAQIFDVKGNHERTAYAGIWDSKGDELSLKVLRLADGKLYYALSDDYHYSMEAATGYINQWHYEKLLDDDGAVLAYSSDFRETPYTLGMRFCLTDAQGKASEIMIPEYDYNLGMALDFLIKPEYTDREGITYEAAVTLDSAAKTAEITNTKLTYTLDFNDLSYSCSRQYTKEMLESDLASSPDGTRKLWLADIGGEGDGLWGDVVVIQQDGSVTYLCYSDPPINADFFNNDTVLLNYSEALRVYDLKKTPPTVSSLIDLGSVTEIDGGTHTERIAVGMAIDRKNRMLLVATRDYTEDWESFSPVTLTIFNDALKQVATLKTDFLIMPYRNNWIMPCDIALNGDGTADLSWYRMKGTPMRVRYIN
ncbi:MAG TPA: hypothetical protein VN626_00675 [Clostridia bacterium]|nr:hypothetical protein [Clostridia bacterium]